MVLFNIRQLRPASGNHVIIAIFLSSFLPRKAPSWQADDMPISCSGAPFIRHKNNESLPHYQGHFVSRLQPCPSNKLLSKSSKTFHSTENSKKRKNARTNLPFKYCFSMKKIVRIVSLRLDRYFERNGKDQSCANFIFHTLVLIFWKINKDIFA
jgi:hypothetical protein